MKRRLDQNRNGPPGSIIHGGRHTRPNDPRFPGRGPSRLPPTVFSPMNNMGFQGRGRGAGRLGPPANFQGRGPHYGSYQGRGNMQRPPGPPGPPVMRGRGNMMRRGGGNNNMMARGPPGRPPMMIPPPPRGPPVGYPVLNNGMRPPQPQQLPHGVPPPPIHGPPPMLMGPNNHARPPQSPFQHQQSQTVPPPNIPRVVMPHVGSNPANQNFQAARINPQQPGIHVSRMPPVGAPPFNGTATYPNAPVTLAPATNSINQNQTATGHVATTTAQGVSSPKPTADQIDQAWKEYTAPNGMTYYHNPILNESTYTKPLTLTKKETASPAKTNEKRIWQEYKDASSGKKYYSDGVNTTWEKPADFVSDADNIIQTEEAEPSRKKKKSAQKKETSFANKEEAVAAFKGLLLAKGIVPTIKWNEVVKICSPDSRWEVCESALAVGERRQALAEYQTKRANELRNLERQERIRAKDAFAQLLTERLPAMTGFSAWNSRFADVRATLAKDDRFHAVAAEETRENLFLDFCEEFRKRDERKKRNKKRETHDAFLSFLREKEEAGTLSFASTWDSFLSSLDEFEKKDERFDSSATMSESDRHLYFADFVIELQSSEDDKRRRIRDARRRAEKAQREAYRDVLKKLGAERKILPSTRWRSIEELISLDESFNLVQAQDRDSPRALFEEFIGEWDETYHRECSFLSRLLHPPNKKEVPVQTGISYEKFTTILLDEAAYSQEVYGDTRRIIKAEEPISSARLYYDELQSRAAESNRRGSGRRQAGEESSEDEGEIIEDEVVSEANKAEETAPNKEVKNELGEKGSQENTNE